MVINMEHHQDILQKDIQAEDLEVGSRDLEKIFEKDGYYDGKIFYSGTRATYTFIHEDEVISLHLDLEKNAIFFKGHKITSLDTHPNLSDFLGKFRQCILDNPHTQDFIKVYDAVISGLCKTS